MISDLTPVPAYHQQDSDYTCAAACAQMVLVSKVKGGPELGQVLNPSVWTYEQTNPHNSAVGLWHDITADMASNGLSFGNGAHPTSLANVLNLRMNHVAYPNITFKVFTSASREEICSRIVHTIEEHGIAPIVLVWEAHHWVAVTGCNYNSILGSNTITLVDLLLHDPSPAMDFGVSTDHSNGDGCGDGSVGADYRGFTCLHVTYDTWYCTFMECPVPATVGGDPTNNLNGCYVAICATYNNGTDNPTKQVAVHTCSAAPAPAPTLNNTATRDRAVTAARAYLTGPRYGLPGRYPWDGFIPILPGFDFSITDTQQSSQFVGSTSSYYLVPIIFRSQLTPNSKCMPAMVRVRLDPTKINPSNLNGFDCIDSAAVPAPDTCIAFANLSALGSGGVIIPFLVPEDEGEPIELDYTYDPADGALKPELVWLGPSRQSFSPLVVFYRFPLKPQFPNLGYEFMYIRADFQVNPDTHKPANDRMGIVVFDTSTYGI